MGQPAADSPGQHAPARPDGPRTALDRRDANGTGAKPPCGASTEPWLPEIAFHDAASAAKKEHAQTWQRRFAKRYSSGLEQLLSGNSLWDFAEALGVILPDTDEVWLGRRAATIDG